MSQWYFSDSGQQRGPLTKEEIKSMLDSGKIQSSTLVWTKGMAAWKSVGTTSEFEISPYAPPSSEPTPDIDWSGYIPSGPQARPWVRHWARTFDFLLFCLVVGGIAVEIWPKLGEINDKLFGIILLLVYNFVEPIMLATLGTTPFKALLRVRVRKNDGTKPTYFEGVSRMFSLWLRGQGLGIPLATLIMGILSYKRLTNDGITSWDQYGGFTVTHQTVAWWRWVILFGLLAGFIGLVGLGLEAR